MEIEVLVRPDCDLCDEAIEVIEEVIEHTSHTITKTDVENSPMLEELYGEQLPVVKIDDVTEFRLFVHKEELEEKLGISRN